MKQQSKSKNKGKNIVSLDDEKLFREKNLALFYEIEKMRSRENDPAVAAEIERKEEELRKNNEAYLRKYEMLYELDKQDAILREKEKLSPVLKALLYLAASIAGIIVIVIIFAQMKSAENQEIPVNDRYVKWDDIESASTAAANGLLISDTDYLSGEDRDESYYYLDTDPRIPDLDAVTDASLVAEKRYYEWLANDEKTVIRYTPTFFRGIYEAYHSAERYLDSDNFHRYVDDEVNLSYIADIANHLRSIGNGMEYAQEEIALEAIHFVQNIPYCSDSESTGEEEWPKYVVETLYDGCGDCEDKSFLLVGLLKELGYDAALMVFDSHMAVGIADYPGAEGYFKAYQGKNYYYIDPSSPGWEIGKVPTVFRNKRCVIVELA